LFYQTLVDHLEIQVKEKPNNVAFIFNQNDGLQLTYKDLKDKSVLLAQNMMRMGLKKGDRVIISFPMTYELIIVYFACAYSGVIAVPIDSEYVLLGDLNYAFQKSKPSAFFLWDSDRYDKYRSINGEILKDLLSLDSTKEYLKHLIILGEPQNVKNYNYPLFNTQSYDDIALKRLNEVDLEYPYIDMDDTFFILFTSGTTSKKKGVVLRHNLMDFQRISRYAVGRKKSSLFSLIGWPLYHLSGIMSITGNLAAYNTMVFPAYEINSLDIMKTADKYKCVFLAVVPRM
jgi:fatty-acyl-CoA synthase